MHYKTGRVYQSHSVNNQAFYGLCKYFSDKWAWFYCLKTLYSLLLPFLSWNVLVDFWIFFLFSLWMNHRLSINLIILCYTKVRKQQSFLEVMAWWLMCAGELLHLLTAPCPLHGSNLSVILNPFFICRTKHFFWHLLWW